MKAEARPGYRFPRVKCSRERGAVCVGDGPIGSSVQTSLRLMDHLAKAVQEAPVIEWGLKTCSILSRARISSFS